MFISLHADRVVEVEEAQTAQPNDIGAEVSVPEVATSSVDPKEPVPCDEAVEEEDPQPVYATDKTAKKGEDVAVTDGNETEIEAESLRSKRSVPPHLRSDLQTPTVRQPPSSGPRVSDRSSRPRSIANTA